MYLEQHHTSRSINRLKRAKGQLEAVIRMLEEGTDCEKVVMQLAACSKAIDRAGYQLIATGMRQCLEESETGDDFEERLEKMFLSLS